MEPKNVGHSLTMLGKIRFRLSLTCCLLYFQILMNVTNKLITVFRCVSTQHQVLNVAVKMALNLIVTVWSCSGKLNNIQVMNVYEYNGTNIFMR